MRTTLSLSLFLMILNAHAQIDIQNRISLRKDSSFAFAQTPNIFAVTGAKNGNWQLKAGSAQIERTDSPWLFKVEPSRLGTDTFLLIRNGKVMLTKIFTIIPEPPLTAQWGVLKKDTASTVEIISNRRMTLSMKGRIMDPRIQIVRFDVSFITSQSSVSDRIIRIQGNLLTKEAADLISKLRQGDKIVFSSVIVQSADSRAREIPGFTIVIK